MPAKTAHGLARLLAIITSFVLVVGGVVLGPLQSVVVPEAAAQALGTLPIPGWHTDNATNRHRLLSPMTPLDKDTLYGSGQDGGGYIKQYATGGLLPTVGSAELIANSAGGHIMSSSLWVSTIAVDADPYGERGKKYAYLYSWNASVNRTGLAQALNVRLQDMPDNLIPIFRVGENETETEVMAVPAPNYFRQDQGFVSGYNYWSAGEVIQETGDIFFGGGECNTLNGSYNMMILNPTTGAYNFSGKILPLTQSDDIFGTANTTCGGTGYVSSDFALDSDGNAYILVRSTQGASAFGLSPAPRTWLVRVVPNTNGAWTYNLVVPLSPAPNEPTATTTVVNGTGTVMIYGAAFYQGSFYFVAYQTNGLYRVNPMSGQTYRVDATTAPNRVQDMASGQTAMTLKGVVYNDVNGDGNITGDSGVSGQTVALYLKNPNTGSWVYQGARTTDGSGNYSFLLGGAGEYIARLVQPKIGDVNAIQTYASGGGTLNPVSAQCVNAPSGEITLPAGGECVGAKSVPFADAPLPTAANAAGNDASMQPSDMAMYTTITITTDREVANANFGITTAGSYGDAAAGPASGPGAPAHVQGTHPVLWLGTELGTNSGPATNGTAHNATDDGVFIKSYVDEDNGWLPMGSTVLAASRVYPVEAYVSGPAANQAKVQGWATGADNNNWSATPIWTPTRVGNVWSGPFQPLQGGTITGTAAVDFRVDASVATITKATNDSGEYYAGATGAPNWTTQGEIEDYSLTLADAVYRPAAYTTGGTGNFVVAGQSLTSVGPTLKVGQGVAASAGQAQSLTATVPSGWSIVSVTIKDTLTGDTVVNAFSPSVTNGTATFSWTPVRGDDVIIEVLYSQDPDTVRSTLTLDRDTVAAGGTITATATIVNAAGAPLRGLTVSFSNKSAAVSLSDDTCVTDVTGKCSVAVTSNVKGVYRDEVFAKVRVAGVETNITGSPATVTFTNSDFSWTESDFHIDPAVDPADSSRADWREANGTHSYSGVLTARDNHKNLIDDLDVSKISFDASHAHVNYTAVVNNHDGTYSVQYTSNTANPDSTASVAYDGTKVESNTFATSDLPIPFTVGDPVIECDPQAPQCSNISANPTRLVVDNQSKITVLVTDYNGNAVPNIVVSFTLASPTSGVLSAATQATDSQGLAFVNLTDRVAETVLVSATFVSKGTTYTIKPSPVSVVFEADVPDYTVSEFTVTPRVDPADSTQAGWKVVSALESENKYYVASVKLMDRLGNVITNRPVSEFVFTTTSTSVQKSAVATDGNGNYYVHLWSTVAAPSAAVAATPMVSATHLTNSIKEPGTGMTSLPIPFKPGDPGPCNGQFGDFSADKTSLGVGEISRVTAYVTDEHCNAVPGITVQLSTSPSGTGGPVLVAPNTVTDASGKVYATVTDTVARTISVSAQVMAGTPRVLTHLAHSPLDIEFTVGDLDPTKSEFSVRVTAAGAAKVTANNSDTWTGKLVARDAMNNLLTNLSATDVAWGVVPAGVTVSAMNNLGNGVYEVTYRTTKSGAYTASLKYKGNTVGGNETITFVAGAVDARYSNLTVDPPEQIAGAPVTITVTAKDVNDNPVPGLRSTDFTVSGVAAGLPNLEITGFQETSDGVYTYSATSRLVGTFRLTAVVTGVTLTQHPTVTFVAGEVCVTNCDPIDENNVTRFEMDKNYQEANGTAQDTAIAYAYDTYGNAVSNAVVEVKDVTTGPIAGFLKPPTQTVRTGTDGTAVVSWTSMRNGQFTAQGTIDGLLPTTAVMNEIFFITGSIDPTKSELTVTPVSPIVVGNAYTATVTLRDAAGNLLTGETAVFSLNPASPATLSDTKCETTDGVCSVTVYSTKVATVAISAQVSKAGVLTNVAGNGDASKASPKTVAWTHDIVCFSNCGDPVNYTRVEVVGDGALADGRASNLAMAYAYDQYGNAVPGAVVTSTAVAAGLTVVTPIPDTGTNGTSAIEYRSTVADEHWATVWINGTLVPRAISIDNSVTTNGRIKMSFATGVADPTKSYLEIAPVTAQETGKTFTVTAFLNDANGNPVEGAMISFPRVNDLEFSSNTCTSAAGTCTVTVTSKLAGTYTIVGRLGAVPVSNSVQAVFVPGPVCITGATPVIPGNVTRTQMTTNGQIANGEARNIAAVYAYDCYGNPVVGAVVAATSPSAALNIQRNIDPIDANGMTTVYFTSTVTNAYQANITINSLIPSGSPLTVNFGNDAGVASHSSWVVTPDSPLVVGEDAANTYTAKATILDGHDNPVPDAVVSFVVDPLGPVLSGYSCVTNASGQCQITMHSTIAGSYSVTASILDGIIRVGTPATGPAAAGIVWIADAVCSSVEGCFPVDPNTPDSKRTRVVVTTNNAVANGAAHNVITAYAFDKWGNAVEGALVQSTIADTIPLTIQTGIAGISKAGSSTIWYATTVSGDYTPSVTIAGQRVPGSTLMTFVPGGICVIEAGCISNTDDPQKQTRVVVTTNNQPVDGDPDVVTAYAHDANGNRVPNATFTFVKAVADDDLVITPSCTTNASGTCTANANAMVARVHQARAYVADVELTQHGSPLNLNFNVGGICIIEAGCEVKGPGEDPDRQTRAEVSLNDQPIGHGRDVITVHAHDMYGNAISNVGFNVTTTSATLYLEGGTLRNNVNVLSGALGTGTTGGTSTQGGSHPARVFVSGVELSQHGSPLDVRFMAPPTITSPKDQDITNKNPLPIAGTGQTVGDTITVNDLGVEVCTATVQANLTWSCSVALDDGDHTLTAKETTADGHSSDPSAPVIVTIRTVPPSNPVVDDTNGSLVTGLTDPDTVINVYDEDGKPVPGCVDVRPSEDGAFACAPVTKIPAGSEITVIATDPAGNDSDPITVTVLALEIELLYPSRNPGETQVATGRHFNPGEKICLTIDGDPTNYGCQVADDQGVVTFTFTIPTGMPMGIYTVTVTGETSGSVSVEFIVTMVAPPEVVVKTGGTSQMSGSSALAMTALFMVLVGLAGLPMVRRYGQGRRTS